MLKRLINLKSDVDELDISKYKNVPGRLSSLNRKVDKLDIAKLKTIPIDLSKLSNIVKNDVFKKTEYDELVKTVSNIKTTDTIGLVKKADYDTKMDEIEKKNT